MIRDKRMVQLLDEESDDVLCHCCKEFSENCKKCVRCDTNFCLECTGSGYLCITCNAMGGDYGREYEDMSLITNTISGVV